MTRVQTEVHGGAAVSAAHGGGTPAPQTGQAATAPTDLPLVSIILPTYNRASFLPQAIQSICEQQWTDWELVVIDDGSTDETREVLDDLTSNLVQSVRYVYQENQGASEARNTGLDYVRGKYVAFFDSDDLWLPHHLSRCVAALEANPTVDWAYGASRIVDKSTGRILAANTFYESGKPRRFQGLATHRHGDLHVLADDRVTHCTIEHGLMCGLQCSVIRRELFASLRIPSFRIGEDRLLPVLALKQGRRLGYLDDVHVIYRIHESNTSGASRQDVGDKSLRSMEELIRAYEELLRLPSLSRSERRSVRRRLCRECFWHVGYAMLSAAGRRDEALPMYRRGLNYWPWDWRCWKTYLLAIIRRTTDQGVNSLPTQRY
jgi:glycosyltransferase involved in cell wall biosynthesis